MKSDFSPSRRTWNVIMTALVWAAAVLVIAPVSYTHLDVYKRQGEEFELLANCFGPEDVGTAMESGASGVGLLRSSYMMMPGHAMDEQEQYLFYTSCLAAARGRMVTVRTFDSVSYTHLGGGLEVEDVAQLPVASDEGGGQAGAVGAGDAPVSYTHLFQPLGRGAGQLESFHKNT